MRILISCEQAIRKLSPYLERELSPAWRVLIQEHLRGCRKCAAVYDGVRNVLLLVTDNPEIVSVPYGFGNRLYRLLRERNPSY